MSSKEGPQMFAREPVSPEVKLLRQSQIETNARDRATIMLPTGRLGKDVKSFFKAIGLEFADTDRSYFIRVDNMPVDFVVIEAGEIPQRVGDLSTGWGTIGVTGSETLWEQEKNTTLTRNSGDILPIAELVPDFNPSSLYIGVSNKFVEAVQGKEGREPELKDLAGRAVVTKLPNIAKEVLAEKGIDAQIQRVSGPEGSWQYLNRGYFAGALGVTQPGKTAGVDDIRVLENFYDISIRLINADWERYDSRISQRELGILDDLREMTYVALQKKRTG